MTSEAPHPIGGRSVLVTGASGFLGSALCRQLVRSGAEVHATSRNPLSEPNVRWQACDLVDFEAARKLFQETRPHVVMHMASHVSGARTVDAVLPTFHDNLSTTVNVLLAAHEVTCERVVLAGSVEEPEPTPHLSVPHSPYAAAKHAAGAYGRMFHALYGLPVTSLRVAMAYGPGQGDLNKLVPHVITSLLRREAPILSSGEREVDWVYVDDVVNAFVCAATTPGVGGLTLDVGSGRLVTVRRVVEQLFALVAPDVTPQFGGLADRPLEQVCLADVEATSRQMDWRPQVGLLHGLSRTVDWYRQQRGHTWDSAPS